MDSSIRMWRRWLSDEWNGGDLVEYKLTWRIAREPRHGRGMRRAKLQAGQYIMQERGCEDDGKRHEGEECEDEGHGGGERGGAELLYREVSGELARYMTQENVPQILHYYHDCHGHFAGGMIVRTLQGKYYWPIRT